MSEGGPALTRPIAWLEIPLDLFTASRRFTKPIPLTGEPLAIDRHAIVGDGFSCVLIGTDGSVAWQCLPHFDSPSVFGAIVDPERGGRFQIQPSARDCETLQSYDGDTNVLQTLFRNPDQYDVVLTDFMPWTQDLHSSLHEHHRLLEARSGAAEMEIVFDPRFDYGRDVPRIEITEHGAIATGNSGERLCISLSSGIRFEQRPEGGVVARFRLQRGRREWAITSWGNKRPEPVAAFRPFEQLRRTRRFWRTWAAKLRYDGPWRHDVLRSALTLKLLQFAPTGAMVAAPTTSLPAWVGGERNWDYRFSWTRDSAMAIRAMNLIGYGEEARDFFHFVRDCVDRRGRLDIMVSIHGGDVPEEAKLDLLAGHRMSRPVRIGNAAANQVQHDITGPLIDAALLYERTGGMAPLRLWQEVRHLVDKAITTIGEPDQGIWEPRTGPTHNVHSKVMTWVALDRALELAPRFGGDREEARWRVARDTLHAEILERGYDERAGTFVSRYEGHQMDATLLLMPIYGFLPPEDPRVVRTIDRAVKELGEGRFVKRYREEDGIHSEEGAFV
ncbi:MAG: glycoside hydrolase family 15 protein, partial [bacterium]|nr:glycoside hydrolase family 15 protein [bacterium]